MRKEYLARGWDFKEVVFPKIKVHFLARNSKPLVGMIADCTDYNYVPVSVVYTDLSFHPLKYAQIPEFVCPGVPRRIVQEHPITHLPFICLRGIREYHTHYQHQIDSWGLYRYPETYNIYHAIRVAHDLLRL